MTEGAEAPGPPEKQFEPAASADTGPDCHEVSAGRPGYASDEGTHAVSGPSHGERKKGERAAAPARPPVRAHATSQAKASRPQKVAAGASAHGSAAISTCSRCSKRSSGFQKWNHDIRLSRFLAEGSAWSVVHGARQHEYRLNCLHRAAGVPWTEGEHRLFLLGLQKLGKVSARRICSPFSAQSSRVLARPKYLAPDAYTSTQPAHFLRARCAGRLARHLSALRDHPDAYAGQLPVLPAVLDLGVTSTCRGVLCDHNMTNCAVREQVASHAQKHFIRQSSLTKRKRRSSLFDITGDGAENSVRAPSPLAAPGLAYTAGPFFQKYL